jgi:hypothetical protein
LALARACVCGNGGYGTNHRGHGGHGGESERDRPSRRQGRGRVGGAAGDRGDGIAWVEEIVVTVLIGKIGGSIGIGAGRVGACVRGDGSVSSIGLAGGLGIDIGIDRAGRRDVFGTVGSARDDNLDVGGLVGRGHVVELLQAGDLALDGEGQSQVAGALCGQAGALDLFGDEVGILEAVEGVSRQVITRGSGGVRSGGFARTAGLAGTDEPAADVVMLAGEDLGLEGHFALVGILGGSGDGALTLDGTHEVHIAVDAMLGADLLAIRLEVVADGAGSDAELLGDGSGAKAAAVELEGAVHAGEGVGIGWSIVGVVVVDSGALGCATRVAGCAGVLAGFLAKGGCVLARTGRTVEVGGNLTPGRSPCGARGAVGRGGATGREDVSDLEVGGIVGMEGHDGHVSLLTGGGPMIEGRTSD